MIEGLRMKLPNKHKNAPNLLGLNIIVPINVYVFELLVIFYFS